MISAVTSTDFQCDDDTTIHDILRWSLYNYTIQLLWGGAGAGCTSLGVKNIIKMGASLCTRRELGQERRHNMKVRDEAEK